MSRVLCRRGVCRGAVSRSFSAAELLDALNTTHSQYVYVEYDAARRVVAAGGGAAPLCVRARLAPCAPAARALLALAPPAASSCAARLLLRVTEELAPHQELLLWFSEEVLAALDMPFLTPRNIRARRHYACHHCAAAFDEPNPLKLHLFLRCAPFEPARFWRRVAARLAAPPAPAPPAPAPLSPGALEALATEWGRSRDGHLCLYCGKLYSRRYGLKIHLRTHTGYRPLRCRYCQRAFGDPSNLNKHVRLHAAHATRATHTHACAVCGRTLARRRDLLRHARAHAACAAAPLTVCAPTPLTDCGPTPLTDCGPTPLTDSAPAPLTDCAPAPLTKCTPALLTDCTPPGSK